MRSKRRRVGPFASHNKNIVATARAVIRDAHAEEEFDGERFGSVVAEYEAAVDDCAMYVKTHPEETRSVTYFDPFLDEARALGSVAREFADREGNETSYTYAERMHMDNGNAVLVRGTRASVIDAYNDMVKRSNGLSWHAYERSS